MPMSAKAFHAPTWMGLDWYPVPCKTDDDRRKDAINGSAKLKKKLAGAR
jgi:hypothetical protein